MDTRRIDPNITIIGKEPNGLGAIRAVAGGPFNPRFRPSGQICGQPM